MTKPKLEPVRAWAVWHRLSGIDANMCRKENPDVTLLPGICEWVQVEITPILPTHPHELSGNTGELKQTKETPSDVISTIELNQLMLRAGGMEKEAALRVAEEIGRLESQLEDYRKALEWLENKVYEGKGTIDFLLTEDGDIGVFRGTERDAMGSGSDPIEAIQSAMAKEARNE